MFWGITLDSGKKYTQVLQRSFCVTMAALGFENASNDNVFVVAEVNNSQHVLCSLQAGKIPQQVLNLSFTEGEHVSFFIEGEGQVHLTGYLTPDDDDSDLSDDESDNEENIQSQSDSQSSQVQEKVGENGENTEVSNISWQGMLSGSQEDVNKVNGIEYGMDVSPDDIEDHPCDDEDIDDMLLNQNCVENGNNMNRINGNEETSSEVSEALDEKGVSKTRRSTSRRKKKEETCITQVLIDDASSTDGSDSTYMIAGKEQKPAAKRKRSNTNNSVDQKIESKVADKKPRNNGIKPQSKQSNKKTDINSKKRSLKRDPPKKEPVKNKKTSGKSK